MDNFILGRPSGHRLALLGPSVRCDHENSRHPCRHHRRDQPRRHPIREPVGPAHHQRGHRPLTDTERAHIRALAIQILMQSAAERREIKT